MPAKEAFCTALRLWLIAFDTASRALLQFAKDVLKGLKAAFVACWAAFTWSALTARACVFVKDSARAWPFSVSVCKAADTASRATSTFSAAFPWACSARALSFSRFFFVISAPFRAMASCASALPAAVLSSPSPTPTLATPYSASAMPLSVLCTSSSATSSSACRMPRDSRAVLAFSKARWAFRTVSALASTALVPTPLPLGPTMPS
mmetsp:Transcript_70964/g.230374  ORF Transcript_70964/g.230374 Transcript_70964/m.230374 type:complete len:207 (+) Transcript_70964:341-961(+)